MGEIHEKLSVHCPICQAEGHLHAFFTQQKPGPDGTLILPLRTSVQVMGGPNIAVERNVKFSVRSATRSLGNTKTVYDIDWEVEVEGPFPYFSGSLSIAPDEDYDTFILALDGAYVPPFGAAGRVFDATIGSTIGRTSARDLLTRMRDFVEVGYLDTETCKKNMNSECCNKQEKLIPSSA